MYQRAEEWCDKNTNAKRNDVLFKSINRTPKEKNFSLLKSMQVLFYNMSNFQFILANYTTNIKTLDIVKINCTDRNI